MKRIIPALLVALGLLSFGCIDYDEQMVLKKDGSGRVSMRMAVSEESYNTMKEMAESFGGGETAFPEADKSEIEKILKERNSGAKLEKYDEKRQGGDRVWELAFSFQDEDDLADISYALDDDHDPNEAPPFSFAKQEDGSWLFRRTLDVEDEGGSASASASARAEEMETTPEGMPDIMGEDFDPENFDAEEFAAKMQENVAKMMESMENLQADLEKQEARMEQESKDRRIRFSVELPGKVIDSNATRVDGKKAIWEYTFEEMQQMGGEMPEFWAKVK